MKTSSKGVNLISLTIAIIVLLIISSVLIFNTKTGLQMKSLEMMKDDIEILQERITNYYNKYGTIPIDIKYNGDIEFQHQVDDIFYIIDLHAFNGITLNYGKDFSKITKDPNNTTEYTDVYIINEKNNIVYYAKGIEIDGIKYYTSSFYEE